MRAVKSTGLAALLPCAAAAVNYTLESTNFNRTSFEVQPYVSNGYIGQRIPVEGFGYSEITPINATAHDGTNGWPLFDPRFTAAMVAGFYDHQNETAGVNFPEIQGGEQPISTLPTWSTLYLTVGSDTYDINTPSEQISNWTQTMSITDGLVTTSLIWTPGNSNSSTTNSSMSNETMTTNGSASINGTSSTNGTSVGGISLKYSLFAHRTLPNLGVVRLDVSGLPSGQNVSITDALDGAGAWRTTPVSSGLVPNTSSVIHSAVQPVGVPNVTAYITSLLSLSSSSDNSTLSASISPSCGVNISTNASTASLCYTVAAPSNGTLTAIKYVGIASTDAFNGTELQTALNASMNGNMTGWDSLYSSHSSAWTAIWDDADIIIPNNDELQLATRASLFHLLSNVREGKEGPGLGDNSIAPAGLTSDSYAGQIFWDADVWMYPSLLALQPSYAESINNYRFKFHPAAEQNAQQYNRSGALYPWTGARYGNCTAVGPCYDYEYHLNNDIALAHYQYYAATGNKTWLAERGWPIISAVAEFWASQVVYNETTGSYNTYNETDPDEYANFVNNAAFTNAGISVLMQWCAELSADLNITIPDTWKAIGQNITVLYDQSSKIVLEYDGFNGTTEVKQADVVLLEYPLGYNWSTTDALAALDFYALATSPNGPGMTYSVFSIDSSELSPAGCASWTYLLAASQPYSRAPFYQFSEQTSDVYALNGGTNPAYTFLTGHGGFLQSFTHGFTGYRSRTDAFYLDPTLPPQLTNYTVKGMKWRNATFDITLTTNSTILSYRAGDGNVSVEVDARNSNSGNFTMSPGQNMTLGTTITNQTLVSGNMAQCAATLTNDYAFNVEVDNATIVAGQYGLAAIDGSNATTWQPLTNASSTLSVDLGSSQTISSFHVNWGSNPPTNYSIFAGNDIANLTGVANGSVNISAPYDLAVANMVAPRAGNLTDIPLGQNITARYVNLTIAGSLDSDGKGGTVAEFAVL